MKTGIPIYPKPEYISYATAALSVAFPQFSPVFGAIGAAASAYVNSFPQGFSPQVQGVSPQVQGVPLEQRYVRAIAETKWSNTEDSKMPKYSGKGTFLKL
jgi:hypothetical protein